MGRLQVHGTSELRLYTMCAPLSAGFDGALAMPSSPRSSQHQNARQLAMTPRSYRLMYLGVSWM